MVFLLVVEKGEGTQMLEVRSEPLFNFFLGKNKIKYPYLYYQYSKTGKGEILFSTLLWIVPSADLRNNEKTKQHKTPEISSKPETQKMLTELEKDSHSQS